MGAGITLGIILGIIVSAVVSVAVTMVFQKSDKNKSGLEKVKRYADKRQNEFDAYFREKADKLTELATTLETKNIQAQAAAKKLEQQYEQTARSTASLEKPAQEVHALYEKINSYDTIIKSLMEMTAAVEQNLQKVKNEAGIVDKLNTRLDSQQKVVDAIERKVPELMRQFSEKNIEQLTAVGGDLLSKYEGRASEIDTSTSRALEQYAALMKKIESDIKGAYTAAEQKARSLEDDSFKNLKKQSDERTQRCMNELNSLTNQLSALIDAKVQDAQENIMRQSDRFSNALSEMDKKLNAGLTQKSQELAQMVLDETGSVSDRLDERTATLESEYADKISDLENSLRSEISVVEDRVS